MIHGIGATGEYPYMIYEADYDGGQDYDGVVEPNMTLCVESFIGHEEGGRGGEARRAGPGHRDRHRADEHVPVGREAAWPRGVTMGMPFPPLPSGPFDIIYADPPWDYKGQLQHAGEGSQDTGGAVRHYPTVTLDDLKTLDIPSISARDCLLFMWATNPHLDQAIDLGKAWGFAWATVAFRVGQGEGKPRLLYHEPMRALSRVPRRVRFRPRAAHETSASSSRPSARRTRKSRARCGCG